MLILEHGFQIVLNNLNKAITFMKSATDQSLDIFVIDQDIRNYIKKILHKWSVFYDQRGIQNLTSIGVLNLFKKRMR